MPKKLLALTLMSPLLCGTDIVISSAWRWRKDPDDKINQLYRNFYEGLN